MMVQQIKQEITSYIANNGGTYGNWYAGITSDINQRLFDEHGVNRETDYWIYRTADSPDDARTVEQYLLDLGCDGGTGGGDNTSKTVYAYKKNSHTNP